MDEKKLLSPADPREFSPFLMVAGSETTPTLISGLAYYLLSNQNLLNSLER
jgi:cytochrome P450